MMERERARATIYEVTARAYLVMLLFSTSLEDLVMRMDETTTSAILASIVQNEPPRKNRRESVHLKNSGQTNLNTR
jgi:hypothetical protein